MSRQIPLHYARTDFDRVVWQMRTQQATMDFPCGRPWVRCWSACWATPTRYTMH